ncbi:penicillin-binding protein activator [Candidatus Woesearchaeota archaeon]|nr:penicillin-binding protein activator [Candidatus Woesearchaeota archaeon]
MNINKILTVIGIVSILLATVVFAGCTAETQQPATAEVVKIGVMLPLSGDAASFGESIKKGIELAKKEMKLDNVKLVYEDTKCSGKDAVTGINKLITVDGVKAVIGEVCSSATLPAAPIANQYEVPIISPSSSSPKIKDAGDYVFRVIPSDDFQGVFAATVVNKKGFKKLGILYTNDEYGVGLKTVLEQSFKIYGEVAVIEAFEKGATDLRPQLTKMKNANVDAIFLISSSPDASAATLKQVKELAMTVQMFGSEALYDPNLLKTVGNAAEGILVTSVTVGTSDFKAKHQVEYNAEAGPFAAHGYDIMKAIGLAVQAGAKTGKEIKEKLYATEFDGATGKIKFDSFGEVTGGYDVYKVEAGKFVVENK